MATLWVDANHPSASDATTKASNTASSPWATIGRAAWGSTNRSSQNAGQAAAAGDTVRVVAGVYDDLGTIGGGSGNYQPLFNPANQGSNGSPIIFESVTKHGAILTSSGYKGPLIGCYDRDYIEWQDFYIDESDCNTDADDSAVIMLWGGQSARAEGNRVVGAIVNASGPGGNHVGLKVEFCDDAIVRNNRIGGIRGNSGLNDTGITLYTSARVLFENNYLHDNQGCNFIEKTAWDSGVLRSSDNVFQLNRIEGGGHGIFISGGGEDMLFAQNIIDGVGENGITLSPLNAGTSGILTRYRFISNSIYSAVGAGIDYRGNNRLASAHFQNNIFLSVVRVFQDATENWNGSITLNRNVFNSFGSVFARLNGVNYNTLSAWRTLTSQDADSTDGAPNFVDAVGGDFHLGASSAATDLGRATDGVGGADGTVIDAGAYSVGDEEVGNTDEEEPPAASARVFISMAGGV